MSGDAQGEGTPAGSGASVRVGPAGTRGTRMPKPLLKLFTWGAGIQVNQYRRSGGQRLSGRMGFPVVLLTTRGAKSGQPRTIPLGGFPDGAGAWLVVASMGGAARHPSWVRNIISHPDDIWLEVGKERFKVRAASLDGPERTQALARIAGEAPRYGGYQQKTDREIPVIRLSRDASFGQG